MLSIVSLVFRAKEYFEPDERDEVSQMRLAVIGSAGSYPAPASACSSYLLQHDGYQLLIDAGNGSMSNLYNFTTPGHLDGVFLSHPHVDHIADFVGIYHYRQFACVPEHKLDLYAGVETVDTLGRLLGSDLGDTVNINIVEPSKIFKIGPFEATSELMAHPVQTYGLRLTAKGKSIAYSADTGPCESLEVLSHKADLFLCESTWIEESETYPKDLHMTVTQAVGFALRGEVGKLLLTHIAYPNSPFVALAKARELGARNVELAFDLEEHSI